MTRRLRLDAELVRRGLARSRDHASQLICSGRVSVAGQVATKSATAVSTDVALVVTDSDRGADYVSRGGVKLESALAAFMPNGLEIAGRWALDLGASTGGFTDVLLRNGVRQVVAVDVGYGQLAWSLREDDRVSVLDRTNVRSLTLAMLPAKPDLVVGDLSFISLTAVIPGLALLAASDADLVLLVKPQFEVGRGQLGKGGVVRDPQHRVDAVVRVSAAAALHGLGTRDVCASALPGPAGNVEYFVWLSAGGPPLERQRVSEAILEGPR